MEKDKVTIKDIADELGLSTATISNVIHGKTKKISDRTVAKVQEKLEQCGYIPNMAAILLAQNTSRIVCVVLSNDEYYQNHMLEDPFISGMLNYLSKDLEKQGFFMMLKEEKNMQEIVKYASMWNMAGLILIGYCAADYEELRKKMHIPFVVVDAYVKNVFKYSDVGIDNLQGGRLAGNYLAKNGHKRIMYLAESNEDCAHDRYQGLKEALSEHGILILKKDFKEISQIREERIMQYGRLYQEIRETLYTAAFMSTDKYAIEFMNYLQDRKMHIPEEFSIIGFDNIPLATYVRPALTTISQNLEQRSHCAVKLLMELMDGKTEGRQELLPVELVERESVKDISNKV